MTPGDRDARLPVSDAGPDAGSPPGSVAADDDEPQPAVTTSVTQTASAAVRVPSGRRMRIGRSKKCPGSEGKRGRTRRHARAPEASTPRFPLTTPAPPA